MTSQCLVILNFFIKGLLQSEVFQLKEHLSSMARELAEREERGGERDSLGVGSTQDEGETDSLGEIKPGKIIQIVRNSTLGNFREV